MSNDLTLFGGNGGKIALKSAKGMAAALKGQSQQTQGDLPDGGVYVSFSGKLGKYSIGQESADADPNEVWLVNVMSFEAGWICWKGGNPLAKRVASVFGEPVQTPDFNEHGPFNTNNGEGWSNMTAFMMRSLDKGVQGYFSVSSKSGLREFGKLQGEIARRLEEGLPCWPVIQLDKESFTAKGFKNFKPVLHVAGWLGMRQLRELMAMTDQKEIAAAVDDLIAAAEEDEANGVMDTTMDGGDQVADQSSSDQDDDGIEDADVVDDDADFEAADEDEEEEPTPAPEPAKAARPARAPRAANAAPADPAPSGLARRRRG